MNWTPKADAKLRKRYRKEPARELAKQFGTTKASVIGRAWRFGLSVRRPQTTSVAPAPPSYQTPWHPLHDNPRMRKLGLGA